MRAQGFAGPFGDVGPSGWRVWTMIMGSLGRYTVETTHDHDGGSAEEGS
jgi:hypothetical protein